MRRSAYRKAVLAFCTRARAREGDARYLTEALGPGLTTELPFAEGAALDDACAVGTTSGERAGPTGLGSMPPTQERARTPIRRPAQSRAKIAEGRSSM